MNAGVYNAHVIAIQYDKLEPFYLLYLLEPW